MLRANQDCASLVDPPGPIEFPSNFPQRLSRLKEVCGLSWNGFARAIGADPRQVARWRGGVEPAGAAMLSLFELATRTPGGVEVILGLDAPLVGALPRAQSG